MQNYSRVSLSTLFHNSAPILYCTHLGSCPRPMYELSQIHPIQSRKNKVILVCYFSRRITFFNLSSILWKSRIIISVNVTFLLINCLYLGMDIGFRKLLQGQVIGKPFIGSGATSAFGGMILFPLVSLVTSGTFFIPFPSSWSSGSFLYHSWKQRKHFVLLRHAVSQ